MASAMGRKSRWASPVWGRKTCKPDIGDQINKKIIAPLANSNKLSDMPDFNALFPIGR